MILVNSANSPGISIVTSYKRKIVPIKTLNPIRGNSYACSRPFGRLKNGIVSCRNDEQFNLEFGWGARGRGFGPI